MKKITNSMLIFIFAADVVLSVGFAGLIDISVLWLFGEAVLAVLAAVCAYCLYTRFSGDYREGQKQRQDMFNDYKKEMSEIGKSLQELVAEKNDEIDSRITRLIDIQEKHESMTTTAYQMIEEIVKYVGEMEKCVKDIEKSLSTFEDDFNDDFSENMDVLRDNIKKSHVEYNNEITELSQSISNVLERVKENTDNYEKSLKRIENSQKEMNTLRQDDIEILKKISGV